MNHKRKIGAVSLALLVASWASIGNARSSQGEQFLDVLMAELNAAEEVLGYEAVNAGFAPGLAYAFDDSSPAGRRELVRAAVSALRLAGAGRTEVGAGLDIIEHAIRTTPAIRGCEWSNEDLDYVGCDAVADLDRPRQVIARRHAHGVPSSELLALVAEARRSL